MAVTRNRRARGVQAQVNTAAQQTSGTPIERAGELNALQVGADTTVAPKYANETHTAELKIGERAPIVFSDDDLDIDRGNEPIQVVDSVIQDDYAKELAFMEELVEIRLTPSTEKNPPKVQDIHVNGVTEWIPYGKPWITKRKFVEGLVRARGEDITTTREEPNGEEPRNYINRSAVPKFSFSVIRDSNPRGHEWLSRIMQEG